MRAYDLIIVGGGPAGLAAAVSAKENGIASILVIERDNELGGILNQCIHNGFGLHTFKEELTGPEYSQRFIDKVISYGIEFKLDTMVLDINDSKEITAVNTTDGILELQAKTIILAMGCRERPRGALNIPGGRCTGVYTAGTAQKLVNTEGLIPGKEVVILGSGDIGLIMARRMSLEGSTVKACVELMPFSCGLKRNIVQCLEDFNIPLKLSHTIINIHGNDRLEGVTIAQVDNNKKPIKGTEEYISCDTLLLSVGLLPENELSRNANVKLSKVTGGPIVDESMQTNIPGIFSCGNVLHVHDLVDNVTKESYAAGRNAANYINGIHNLGNSIEILPTCGVRYTIPNSVNIDNIRDSLVVTFRVSEVFKDSYVSVYFDNTRAIHLKKRILTPGEMETIKITKSVFDKYNDYKKITIKIEKE